MTTQEKRAIAGLVNAPGLVALLDQVVKPHRDNAMARLFLAKTEQDVLDAALDLRAWERVSRELRDLPVRMVEELKEEGDEVYG